MGETSADTSLRLLVPAYWFPTTTSTSSCSHPDYLRLARAGARVAAIANPYNGPVSPDTTSALYSPDFPKHHACIQALYDAGNEVLGYVSTKLATETSPGVWLQTGFRPLAEVEAAILAWSNHFNLTGIFLDEVSNLWQVTEAAAWGDHLLHYQNIFTLVREARPSWRIIINPGSAFTTSLLGAEPPAPSADLAVVFEGGADRWDPGAVPGGAASCTDLLWTEAQGTFGPGPWCPLVPAWDGADALVQAITSGEVGEAAALIYGASEEVNITSMVEQARSSGITYFYLTDNPKAAPWAALPGYWDRLLEAASL